MIEMRELIENLVVDYGARILGVIVLLIAAWIVSAFAGRVVVRVLEKALFDLTLTKFFGSAARWFTLILAGIAALGVLGVETTSFAAVIAAGGLAVALAFQGTLSNFASGVMLLVFRPFKVGDVVEVAGVTGQTVEIGLFQTTVDTFDNRRVVLPNSSIFGSTIENMSHHETRRAEVPVGVDYGADIDRTRVVLEEAARSVPGCLSDPGPQVVLTGLGASSVDWEVRIWASADDLFSVKQATVRAVKIALDETGIPIPFPQLDVHLDAERKGETIVR